MKNIFVHPEFFSYYRGVDFGIRLVEVLTAMILIGLLWWVTR